MPNRIVREGILRSKRVDCLSEQAEVFYRRLHSVVDDYGRYHAEPVLIRSAAYPLRVDKVKDSHISAWLEECAKCGLILVYESAGAKYLQIERFGQQIRAKTSKYPDPRADDSKTLEISGHSETAEKPQRKTRTNGAHLIGDWQPGEDFYEWANRNKFNPDHVKIGYNKMRDWAIAKGVQRQDWSAQLRNWMREMRNRGEAPQWHTN